MIRILALLLLAPIQTAAVTLDMPANATLVAEEIVGLDSYSMPTAAWSRIGMPTVTGTGEVRQQAWRIDAAGLTTLQLLQPLTKQLTEAGFEVLFTCSDDACGGFDFRFATPVLPAPAMHVDLGDYRFFATQRTVNDSVELLSYSAAAHPQRDLSKSSESALPTAHTWLRQMRLLYVVLHRQSQAILSGH